MIDKILDNLPQIYRNIGACYLAMFTLYILTEEMNIEIHYIFKFFAIWAAIATVCEV